VSEIEVAPSPERSAEHSEYVIERAAVVSGAVLASVVAFVVTDARCGAVALGPVESRSRYCRACTSRMARKAQPVGYWLG
jgi:hypothetical protein